MLRNFLRTSVNKVRRIGTIITLWIPVNPGAMPVPAGAISFENMSRACLLECSTAIHATHSLGRKNGLNNWKI